MPNRILITGGCGFIGSRLAEHYVKLGQPLTVLDNLSTGRRDNLDWKIPGVDLDVTRLRPIRIQFRGRNALNSSMLTSTQRLHFNVNGYVLLEQVFSEAECDAILRTAEEMKTQSHFARLDSEQYKVLYGPAWFDRKMLHVCMDPRLRGPAEEIIGGRARLEENEFLITAAGPPGPPASGKVPRWHRGLRPDYGSFQSGDNYHSLFTKAIVYLTDLEPGQETLVVPGSHKLMTPTAYLAPILDASVTRSVAARAGDVLIFGETLVHSSPSATPSRERTLLVIAYCAPFMRTWNLDTDLPASPCFELNGEEHDFIHGESRYGFTGEDC